MSSSVDTFPFEFTSTSPCFRCFYDFVVFFGRISLVAMSHVPGTFTASHAAASLSSAASAAASMPHFRKAIIRLICGFRQPHPSTDST
jgi:hypothetical protein